MKFQPQRAPFFLGAAAALMLIFSTAAVYPQFSQAADATPAAPSQDSTPLTPDIGKAMGRFGIGGNHEALLAEALGISEADLQAAYLEAANAALDQAVEQDLLTQTQADNLRQRVESAGANGFAFRLGGRGFFNSDTIDGEQLLADALGISIDELQAAYDEAEASLLAQAVENGRLTQEQADLVTARRAFQEYLRSQQKSYEELVQEAVAADVITQAQADLLLENQPSFSGRGFGVSGDFGPRAGGRMMPGLRGPGMDGSRSMHSGPAMDGGRGMHGGRGWDQGGSQDTQPDESDAQSSSSFVMPNASL
jgi:hypothetical protein